MGLLGDFTAYIDNLKRRGMNTAKDLASDPMGLLGRNISALSESLPAAPGEPPNEMLARPGMQDWATGVAMNAPTMGLLGHTVYHGSPHKFNKFDASKIGTGEGAQAYGHGLYLADARDVAKSYASTVGRGTYNGKPYNNTDPSHIAASFLQGSSREEALSGLSDSIKRVASNPIQKALLTKARQALKDGAEAAYHTDATPTLYKVDLPDEWLPKMLDWDKPLSQQPEALDAVRRIASRVEFDKYDNPALTAALTGKHPAGSAYSPPAAEVMDDLASAVGMHRNSPEFAQMFRDSGIPGIRYKDQGSRGKEGGTYNYVVFPGMEHLLKILERE